MELLDLSALLAANAYPGRGIVLGLCDNGKTAALLYFIMGRSENSRNRAFQRDGDDLNILVPDKAKLTDPSLILYTPIRTLEDTVIVTNGDQTDTIYEALLNGSTFEAALESRTFEPDAPHFTPRISGLMQFGGAFSYKLSIVKCGDARGEKAFRQTFAYEPVTGSGHFIHTYQNDANPLPCFSGEPKAVRLPSNLDAFANGIWNALHPENKIALYARFYDVSTGVYEDRLFNHYASEG